MNSRNEVPTNELPTVDQMLAYTRGELAPADEARVREALSRNPDLARALVTPFPEDDAQPGDPDYLSEAEVSQRWNELRPAAAARVVDLRAWRSAFAIAAALAIVFGSLLYREHRLAGEPRVSEQVLLLPDGGRGNGEPEPILSADGRSYVLLIPIVDASRFEQYRLEMFDVAGTAPRSVWRSGTLRRGIVEAFPIEIPRSFLHAGRYRVVLSGLGDGKEEKLETYTVGVR